MTVIGLQYVRGEIVEPDPVRGHRLLTRAAGLGDAGAMGVLGTLYAGGLGIETDLALSEHWRAQALDHGDEPARDMLAEVRERQGTSAVDAFESRGAQPRPR